MRLVALIALVGLASALGWQNLRYLRARRGPVQDQQALFYPSATFHVATFLRARADSDLFEALRKLRGELEGAGAKMVYAGRSASAGLASQQLSESEWDAVVLVQYASREAYDEIAASSSYRSALERFGGTYSHGLDRAVLPNLAIPTLLLALRAYNIVTRKPSHYPFEPIATERGAGPADLLEQLETLRQYSEDAVVVVNLLKGGTDEQRAADRGYGLKMAGLFAEGGHGPMHMGRAVTVEGEASFDNMALVYYPGIDYMRSMLVSTFYRGIVGGKQPGDTLAIPTVPVLSRL